VLQSGSMEEPCYPHASLDLCRLTAQAELLPASGSDAVTQNFLKAAASRRNWQPGRVELVSKLLGLDSELQPSGSGRGHADDTADISEVASLRSVAPSLPRAESEVRSGPLHTVVPVQC
jgi:hypothetical protein